MKYSYFVIALLAVFCVVLLFKKPDCETLPPVTITLKDTVYVPVPGTSLTEVRTDTIYLQRNKKCDSISSALFIAKYKIERVKHFLRIVDNKPSQIKYLKGWVRRAVE